MKKLDLIHQLKEQLDSHRPLGVLEVERLHENYIVKNTYNSNAIEGNTLTEMETRVIIETGLTIEKKTLREHFEVKNHVEALNYIEELAQKQDLTERDIKSIHSIILQGIDRRNAGIYRRIDVSISGASHDVAPFYSIPTDMLSLISWYTKQKPKTIDHIIEFTCKFINIHPFIDGNGRTSRLLMNLELIKLGYPPITVLATDRLEYFKGLDESYYKNYEPIKEFFYDCIIAALNEMLVIIK
ncbi:Fic family protein [Lederbergia sp. NSJ-179]|uniref:Fic family protein n=1 Tax=Lederbergia sp. NSJ-179 TaxID=2931402 RepID=UPI001FD3802F|nr:Fic family protein [Lederbergia sp. NSJ-179]MCJ7841403.1 Fic family protein [Lederbergia sp. NSJ-179]